MEELDRAGFERVWNRVAPGGTGPVEVIPAPPAEEETDPPHGRTLQTLTLGCLADAAAYRALAGRARRSREGLRALADKKTAQAKTLSAAYFLLTGVRYWPRDLGPREDRAPLLPALRERFLAEGRLARDLETLARGEEDAQTAALWLSLAGEARTAARQLRELVRREM